MTDLPLSPPLATNLTDDERFDVVNEQIKLIQKKNGKSLLWDIYGVGAVL